MPDLTDPVLNGPYDPPSRYFEIGPEGPTGVIVEGRRPSESFIPIAGTAQSDGQDALDFDATGERRQVNDLVNEVRLEVAKWRARGYERVTPITRKLLQHWADPHRENRVLFCQREAAETAIFLAEVAGRHGYPDWRRRLDEQNRVHNAGLPRIALKMATGTGKTVVMAMLIAWQTLNRWHSPRDARFTDRFLVVTPGITIRDRLRVLLPGDVENYYDLRDLIPADLKGGLGRARIAIVNYHAFLPKDAREISGVAANTRRLLLAGRSDDPFRETEPTMVARVLRDLGIRQVMVFNDEAHHCYQNKVVTGKLSKDEKAANEEARVWFRGLRAIARHAGVKAIYDLSATPFYLQGSGYNEGYIFPWTVSDFSLMDAIESGIVKVPRTPVDDDSTEALATYLRLWDYVGDHLPKRAGSAVRSETWVPPKELEGALKSLYRSYEKSYAHWDKELRPIGAPPPVFIVVCPNTVVSRLVYDWIAGFPTEVPLPELVEGPEPLHPLPELVEEPEPPHSTPEPPHSTPEPPNSTPEPPHSAPELVEGPATTMIVTRNGILPLLSNYVAGMAVSRPPTILIDSAQLESGDALKKDFREAAAAEIEVFKAEYRRRHPGADIDAISDEDLLREVMNTVGKTGRLGEPVRCVVSVSMLTEGWDANTVTHILGIRPFRSQLLCEQVVGRGLRRRTYAVNDEGRFDPEYANVYGIPFAFIPSDKAPPEPMPKPPAIEVAAVPGREHLRITFPKLDGYRLEIPDGGMWLDPGAARRFGIGVSTVPTRTDVSGVVGRQEVVADDAWKRARAQEVAFALTRTLLDKYFQTEHGDRRPWLFPKLLPIVRQWIEEFVDVEPGFTIGRLLDSSERCADAAEAIYEAIASHAGTDRRGRMRPILRSFDPVGSTGDVSFLTRKAVVAAEKSEVSHVTLDGPSGNTWEQLLAAQCERNPRVSAYVKNDHLGFTIPYLHKGRTHAYVPDFLLRLAPRSESLAAGPATTSGARGIRPEGGAKRDVVRTLIVEVSGGQKAAKSPGPTHVKAATARDSWCAAVNNHGGFGRWGYLEVTSMPGLRAKLDVAIDALYADRDVVGDPDLLDFDERSA